MLNFAQEGSRKKMKSLMLAGKATLVLIEADGMISDDSKIITDRLEELSPEPTLFPDGDGGPHRL